jgi:hypothetical protein
MSGWEAHGDKCFYFSTDTVPKFDDGVAKCKALSPVATLASVASQEELEWILGESRRWPIWIGFFFHPLEYSPKGRASFLLDIAWPDPSVRICIDPMGGQGLHFTLSLRVLN